MDLDTAITEFGRYLHMRGRMPGTERKYRYLLVQYGAWLGPRAWEAATGLLLEAFLEEYSVAHSRSSTALMSTCLRSFYRWARRKRHVMVNPAEELETITRDHPAPRALSDQRVRELLAAIETFTNPEGARNRMIVRTFLFTGLRLAELAGMNREDLDMDARTITVTHAKGGTQRIIPINDTLYADLMQWGIPDSGAIFLCHKGRFEAEGISQMFRRIIQSRLGFHEVTAHVLRHTHATKLRRCGADLRQLQTQLGHELPETTAIYTKVYDEELHEVTNRLSGAW